MRVLSYNEFYKRTTEVQKAKKIFGELTEKNVSKAFEAYQEILADEAADVFISTAFGGRRAKTWVDKFGRPKCEACGADMRLFPRKINESPEVMVGGNWKSLWVCPECDNELWSEWEWFEWMEALRKDKDIPVKVSEKKEEKANRTPCGGCGK